MQLTKHTDYAFRVLLYLAGMQEERTTIQGITDAFDVSKAHLMKVVNKLTTKGWIKSTRGKNGGICLGVEARDICLKEVVVYMEKTLDPINCDTPMCPINGVCRLKPILFQAQAEYLNHLANYTLADLLDQKTIIRLRC